MKDGNVLNMYARSYEGLFRRLEGKEIVKVVCKTIKPNEMKQGKEKNE